MRHRKKLLFATPLLIAAYATLCFWPHSNPEAVRALEAMRGMIDIDERVEEPPVAEAKPRMDVQIESRVVLATINMTDATAGLFAEPGRISDKAVVGRLKSNHQFLELVHSGPATQVEAGTVITELPGWGRVTFGGSVPVIAPAPVGAAPPAVVYRHVGTTFTISTRITTTGAIVLDFDSEVTQTGRTKSVTSAQGSMEIPEVHSLKAKARAELKHGETLVIGGLSQKRPARIMYKFPGVSDLPGIGTWFSFTHQREIEEELVVFVTPRIVTSVAAK